eukprot:3370656-Prymnesium_polylepis.1
MRIPHRRAGCVHRIAELLGHFEHRGRAGPWLLPLELGVLGRRDDGTALACGVRVQRVSSVNFTPNFSPSHQSVVPVLPFTGLMNSHGGGYLRQHSRAPPRSVKRSRITSPARVASPTTRRGPEARPAAHLTLTPSPETASPDGTAHSASPNPGTTTPLLLRIAT